MKLTQELRRVCWQDLGSDLHPELAELYREERFHEEWSAADQKP